MDSTFIQITSPDAVEQHAKLAKFFGRVVFLPEPCGFRAKVSDVRRQCSYEGCGVTPDEAIQSLYDSVSQAYAQNPAKA